MEIAGWKTLDAFGAPKNDALSPQQRERADQLALFGAVFGSEAGRKVLAILIDMTLDFLVDQLADAMHAERKLRTVFNRDIGNKVLFIKEHVSNCLSIHFAPGQRPDIIWSMLESGSSVAFDFSIIVVQDPRFAYPSGQPVEGLRSSDDICTQWGLMLIQKPFAKTKGQIITPHQLQAHLTFTSIESGTQPVLRTIDPDPVG